MLFRHRCAVARKQVVGTNGRTQLGTVALDVRSLFIPMSTRAEMENGFEVGTGYDIYFPPSEDVRRGDQLTFDGKKFDVRHVQDFTQVPSIAHKHATASCEAF